MRVILVIAAGRAITAVEGGLSLIDVVEEIRTQDDMSDSEDGGLVEINLGLVAVFEAESKEESLAQHEGKLWITAPDGARSAEKAFPIEFQGQVKCRMTANVQAIPFKGYGRYSFNVQGGESTGLWSFDLRPPAVTAG